MAERFSYPGSAGSPSESNAYADNESAGRSYGGSDQEATARDHMFLPVANVNRIMKKALPVNTKVSIVAKETVQECVSEFIGFVTGEASDKCRRESRKAINGDDLIWAMSTLGFEDYIEPLKLYLQSYRMAEGEKSSTARQGCDNSTANLPPASPFVQPTQSHIQAHDVTSMNNDISGSLLRPLLFMQPMPLYVQAQDAISMNENYTGSVLPPLPFIHPIQSQVLAQQKYYYSHDQMMASCLPPMYPVTGGDKGRSGATFNDGESGVNSALSYGDIDNAMNGRRRQ